MYTAKIKYLLLLKVVFVSPYCFGQQYKPDSLFNRFKKEAQFELAKHKMLVWDDETRAAYYTFMIHSTAKSLVKYASDSIPDIRCLIFALLAQKGVDKAVLTRIYERYSNDTAIYVSKGGCVVVNWTVRDYMKAIIQYKAGKKLPDPDYASSLSALRNERHLIIPGLYHGMAPKDSLVKLEQLLCTDKKYKVLTFSLGTETEKIDVTGNTFNEKAKKIMADAKPGDTLLLYDIKMEGPDGNKIKFPSLVLDIM